MHRSREVSTASSQAPPPRSGASFSCGGRAGEHGSTSRSSARKRWKSRIREERPSPLLARPGRAHLCPDPRHVNAVHGDGAPGADLHRFDLSKVETGALFTVSGLAIIAVAMPAGLLADRIGARAVTIAAAGLLNGVRARQGAADSYPALLAARGVFGVGWAAILSAGPAWLADSVTHDRRPAALGAVMPVAGIGGSSRRPRRASSLIGLASAPPSTSSAESHSPSSSGSCSAGPGRSLRHPRQPLATTLRALTRDSLVLGGVVAMALAGFTESGVNLLAPLQLKANGLSAGSIGVVFDLRRRLRRHRQPGRWGRSAICPSAGGRCRVGRHRYSDILPMVVSPATAAVVGSVISRTGISAVLYTIAFPLGALGAHRAGLGRGAVNGLLTLASGFANALGPLTAGAVGHAAGSGGRAPFSWRSVSPLRSGSSSRGQWPGTTRPPGAPSRKELRREP